MSEMTPKTEESPRHIVDGKYHIGAPFRRLRDTLFIWSGGSCTYRSWLVFVKYDQSAPWLPSLFPFPQGKGELEGSRRNALHIDEVLQKLVQLSPCGGCLDRNMLVRIAPTNLLADDRCARNIITFERFDEFLELTYPIGSIRFGNVVKPKTAWERDVRENIILPFKLNQSPGPAVAEAEQIKTVNDENKKQENPANAEVTVDGKGKIMSTEKSTEASAENTKPALL